MTSFYDEVEIEDMDFDPDSKTYTYPCPCGDKFQITVEDLLDGEETARCPSCSLILRVPFIPSRVIVVILTDPGSQVIYDPDEFQPDQEECMQIQISVC